MNIFRAEKRGLEEGGKGKVEGGGEGGAREGTGSLQGRRHLAVTFLPFTRKKSWTQTKHTHHVMLLELCFVIYKA